MSVQADQQQLRLVDRADVYKKGAKAATLTRSAEGVRFDYLPEWIAEGRAPVATSLPVQTEPVVRPGGALPAYFTGLLPEGRRLGALRRQVKTSADDELSLLLAVGADAVGDVRVVPAGEPLASVEPRLRVNDFSEIRFSDLLAELGIKAERTALPGVQDKASAAVLSLPVSRRGARFILKLNPPEYPHLVENEAFFLVAAQHTGIATANARLVTDADGEPGLLVERFDRIPALQGDMGDDTAALAVEDACQVLGRPPADKYVVGTEAALLALIQVCQAPLPAARTLLGQLAFAYISGNGDAHAKNFSVLQDADGEWRPSPAYDLPSSQPYGDTTMAMSIGGRVSGDFGGRDFQALGAHLGLPDRATRKLLDDIARRSAAWLEDLDELPFDIARTRKLRKVAEHRMRRLTQ